MFDVKVITGPSAELITTAEVKTHLAITHTDDDTYIGTLISQVRAAVEGYCGISIGSQTRKWVYDFDTFEWSIPYGPIISVTSLVRRTGAGTTETLVANDDYELQGEQIKTLVVSGGGRCTLTYVTGYTTLPADLKLGMLQEIAYRYEHRGDVKDMASISPGAESYLIRFKDFNW